MNGRLNSVFGELFTNNYSKNKTKFSFVFSSLIFAFSSLFRYNFEQVIVSRNYIILYSRIKNIFSFSSTGKCSKFYLQADLTISPFRGDRATLLELEAATRGVLWNKLFLKMSQIHKKTSVLETVFNTFAGLTATLLKRDTSTGVFLLTFLLFWNLLWTAASKEYVIGVTDRD